ncbi:MAG: xanthine dehydrogenase family protein molybdopterin-binding subunit [Dehalococcoidia bacterium]
MVATFEPKKNYKVIGTRPIRHDGLDKVTGRAVYGADVKLSGLIWGAVLRSPHAHARIKSIDTSAAEKMPGVFSVMTAKDLPLAESKEVDLGEGTANFKYASNNIMASDKVLYRGHAVAAVAATDRYVAEEAVKLIKVEYEPLSSAVTVEQALAPNAPIILEDLEGDDLGDEVKNTNMAKHIRHEFGDVEGGFSKASTVVEREFKLAMVHQGYIEPHTATATWDQEDRIKIWTSTQGSFSVRTQVAGILKMDASRIRVTPLEIGGGFGGKIPIYVDIVAAVLSKKARGRPVKIVMERKSVFEGSGPASGGTVKIKLGVDDSGKITAGQADIRYEAGAYPGAAIGPGAMCVFACYDFPNSRIDGYDVIVNKPKSAAYRAPGSPQVAFATESVVDEICELGGWDKLEFRQKNASHEGTRRGDGVLFPRIGMQEVLDAVKKTEHWNSKLEKDGPDGKKRGRGIASGYWMNVGLKSSVSLSVTTDGTVALVEGSTDIGGTRASIAMQAAEVLGIPAEDVRPVVVDTDSVGFTDITGGSRVTYATGYAAYNAANNLVDVLKNRAAILWDLDESDIQFEDGAFSSKSDPELRLTFKELAGKLNDTGGPATSTGTVDLESAGGAFATHVVDVEIDPETGKTDVIRYTAVQDAGTAIHPSYVEGQMQGGAVQGIGWALNEEYWMNKDGVMTNSSFLDYRMPTSLDLPMIDTIIVEVPNPLHPFGVRGVGEVPICPPIGAIANAIHNALDIRLYEAPMNAGRILKALGK